MLFTAALACRAPIESPGPSIDRLEVQATAIAEVFRVTFHTEVDAIGEVAFGEAGEDPRLVVGDRGGTDHELLVVGLPAGGAYDLVARATGPGGATEAPPERVDVPALSADEPLPELLVGRSSGGWTILDVTGPVGPPHALIVDEEARPIWLDAPGTGDDLGAVDVKVTPADTVLVAGTVPEGDHPVEVGLDGEIRWQGPEQPGYSDDGFVHHHTDALADGAHVSLEKDVRGGRRGDRVVLRDAHDAVTWSWSTWDHWTADPDLEEWTHLNWVDLRDDVFYVSDELTSTIWKIDRASGDPIWSFGEGGDFALQSGTWFRHQHAPEWGPDGRLWVYDDGLPKDGVTRVVAYRLDEAARTAVQDCSWDGSPDWSWFTAYWGGVHVLANGHLLISAGNPDTRRLMEVDPASGEVGFAFALPAPFSFYRASAVDPARWGIRPLTP
jgi:hypothetical protein